MPAARPAANTVCASQCGTQEWELRPLVASASMRRRLFRRHAVLACQAREVDGEGLRCIWALFLSMTPVGGAIAVD